MDFRTIVPISKTTESITYYTSIVSLGSCFAVNMAQKFAYYKFPITVNPFGVLFHPLAIENILQHTIENSRYTAEDFFLHNKPYKRRAFVLSPWGQLGYISTTAPILL